MPWTSSNAFPITMRELLVVSRRKRTWWDRVLIGGFALLLTWAVIFFTGLILLPQTSTLLYQGTHWLMLLYCLIAGAHTTCDCISWEKREGTLGLLYLSNMSSTEIIMGKLTIATLQTLYGLMVCFPLLALPILMGGVTISDVIRSVVASLNLLFFSSAVGLFCSVVYREKVHSGVAATFILTITVLLPWFYILLTNAGLAPTGILYWLVMSLTVVPTFYPPQLVGISPHLYYATFAITHLYGWLLLASAARLFPRSFHEKSKNTKTSHGWKHVLMYGSARWRSQHRKRFLDKHAFAWLSARSPWVRWETCALLFGGLFLAGWYAYVDPDGDRGNHAFLLGVLMALGMVLKGWVAVNASQILANARDQGTLEWLLSTPLHPKEMIWGQVRATLFHFSWVIGAWYVAFFYLLATNEYYSFRDGTVFLSKLFASFFLLDCFALCILGQWKAITSKQTRTAAPDAISRGLIFPHVIAFFINYLIMFDSNLPWYAGAIFWFVVSACVNTGWIIYILPRFETELRKRAQSVRG